MADCILDKAANICHCIKAGKSANPYTLITSSTSSSAFAIVFSGTCPPHPICANCKCNLHSTNYYIAPGSKMADCTIKEAKAACLAARLQQSCDSCAPCPNPPTTHIVVLSASTPVPASPPQSASAPVFVNGLPYVLDPAWTFSSSLAQNSAHIAELTSPFNVASFPHQAFVALSFPLLLSSTTHSALQSPSHSPSLPFLIDTGALLCLCTCHMLHVYCCSHSTHMCITRLLHCLYRTLFSMC